MAEDNTEKKETETTKNNAANDTEQDQTISPQQFLDMFQSIQDTLKDINGGLEKLRDLQTDNSKPDVPDPEKDEEPKKEDDDKKEKDSDNDGKSDLDEIADALDL